MIPPIILAILVGLFLWLKEPSPEDSARKREMSCVAASLQLLAAASEAQTSEALKRITPACRN